MTPKPERRISLQLRLILTIVFVAFAYFVGQYRKSVPRAGTGPANLDTQPLLTTEAPDGLDRFAWIPAFPGAEMEDINTKHVRGQISHGFSFRTPQDYTAVLSFYNAKLKEAGFQVDMKAEDRGGELHAKSGDGKRSFDVVAAKRYSGSGAEIGVTAVQR